MSLITWSDILFIVHLVRNKTAKEKLTENGMQYMYIYITVVMCSLVGKAMHGGNKISEHFLGANKKGKKQHGGFRLHSYSHKFSYALTFDINS